MSKGIFVSVLILMTLTFIPPTAASAGEECEWSYEGANGPAHWWEICPPQFFVCKAGTRQSPINLRLAPEGDLPQLSFRYHPTALEVENNGHTIEVPVESHNTLRIGREEYTLVQFHFHTPSEHHLRNHEFPMELHFVHRNALGELAVVGVFLAAGAANPVIQKIWDHMPDEPGSVEADGEMIDPKNLLPANRSYYRYAGSLTTPPCSEGVRWHVLSEPIEVSAAQIEQFREIFPLNARPLQPLNDRPVLTERH